ncbi:11138_t:CDS:1, partial [Paraglomus occultum]
MKTNTGLLVTVAVLLAIATFVSAQGLIQEWRVIILAEKKKDTARTGIK